MKKYYILLIVLFAIASMLAYGQRPTMELTFTAINNTDWVQLDSIRVMNRTQGGDTVLYYPDTVLVLDFTTGIPEPANDNSGFQVLQNYPNPVEDQTTISMCVPEKDKVSIVITDILGHVIIQAERLLDKGKHSFRFTPGGGNLYFFTARWQGHVSSIKILNLSSGRNVSGLEYLGGVASTPIFKIMEDVQQFMFNPGDELLYIGYSDTLQSGILDTPEDSNTYTFQFATNIPCPGTPTVEYEGQVYNTIQVFSQCWLKENLNVGTMIQGDENMSDNDTIEKYCYNNEPDSCTKYGGLYLWPEMMQYTYQQGAQGICPPGWHVSTDEEWKVLEGAVDSQYGIGDPEWDHYWDRGYNAGMNLKSTYGWISGGNGTDLFGFSGLPGGTYDNGGFVTVGIQCIWWTNEGMYRWLYYNIQTVFRWNPGYSGMGFSVRCLRDE